MTRKHYQAIANALREDRAHDDDFDYGTAPAWERGAYDQWSTTVLAIARALSDDNPRFDPDRFYRAAGFAERKGGAR